MMTFTIAEDKAVIPKPVEELLQNQEFSKVPLMIGVTNDEFGWLLPNVSKYYRTLYKYYTTLLIGGSNTLRSMEHNPMRIWKNNNT